MCIHDRQFIKQVFVIVDGREKPSTKYKYCLDCGFREITTNSEAFLIETVKRFEKIIRDDR